MKLIPTIARLDATHRLFIALLAAGISSLVIPAQVPLPARIIIVWVAFATAILLLSWTSILTSHPRDLPQLSRRQDSSRTFILIVVVVSAIASLFAVVSLLNSMDKNRNEHIFLPLLAVLSAWTLVHTIFTLHYAHLYYGLNTRQKKRSGGLDFPHETEPDYIDFAYFSFVIGMTSQVSDVAVGSKAMRRTALIHGVLSFFFNVVIIAFTISGLSK